MAASDVPTWNGDASSFEGFCIACRWYQKSLKENEKKQAASRVWQRLDGPAKAVVRHLDPDLYEDETGLQRLLQVLRQSPLQQLPIPDSFSRLEAWHHLKRGSRESIPELLVREEDLFQQLQQALVRARSDRKEKLPTQTEAAPSSPVHRVDPPSTPSRSPVGARGRTDQRPDQSATAEAQVGSDELSPTIFSNFFEDELRGYRLLKSAQLTSSERQHVLVQTHNSTEYHAVRLALRTLFAEDSDKMRDEKRSAKAWWVGDEYDEHAYAMDDAEWSPTDWSPSSWDGWNEQTYWTDDQWYEDESWLEEGWGPETDEFEVVPNEQSDLPEEKQLQEAYALAGEAN